MCNLSWMISSIVLFVLGVDIGSMCFVWSCLLSSYSPTKVGPLPVIHGVTAVTALAGIGPVKERTKIPGVFCCIRLYPRIIKIP